MTARSVSPPAASARRTARGLLWTAALLIAGLAVLYARVVAGLVGDWIHDGNYSHGFVIPPAAAYLAWQRRADLQRLAPRPSWLGVLVVAGGVGLLLLGQLAAEFFLTRVSLIVTLAGIVLALEGWAALRVLAGPLAFLLLMIPLPAILFNQIAFPLQLVASRLGESVISAANIPVLREGNVLVLATTTLEVAEACSGIRSLVSLLTLSLLFGYLADRRPWARIVLAVSTVPIAVVANGVRVAGTGIAAGYLGAAAAEGFLHESAGLAVFAVAMVLLFAVYGLLAWWQPAGPRTAAPRPAPPQARGSRPPWPQPAPWRALVIAGLLVLGAAGVSWANSRDFTPPRRVFAEFPLQVGAWRGVQEPPFEPGVLAVLGADDYLTRAYFGPDRRGVGLYIGYWATRRQGRTIHSPLNCLPGSGWEPISQGRLHLRDWPEPGRETTINRIVVEKGLERQLVLYWFQSQGRIIASEYANRLYMVADAIATGRSDGALVRVIVPIQNDEEDPEQAAVETGSAFIRALGSILPSFVPQ